MNRRQFLLCASSLTAHPASGAGASPSSDQLVKGLEAAGLATVTLGGRIVVMPFGGRVIGLYARPEFNCLWTNPLLTSNPAKVAAAMWRPDWLNPGGDRTWISPELDFHVGDIKRMMETYEVPRAVDPGTHHIAWRNPTSVTLVNHASVPFRRSSQRVELVLTKQIRLLEEPPSEFPRSVKAAGYEVRNKLETTSAPPGTHPAAWHIMQVPGGGVIRVASRSAAQPRNFFGESKWSRQGNSVRVVVEATKSFKLGIHAKESRGQMIYTGRAGDNAFGVIRWFDVAESDRYYDVPPDDLTARGYMTQVYVDDGALGGFGEMEYHAPALEGRVGRTSVEEVSRTWAITGEAGEIESVINAIIG